MKTHQSDQGFAPVALALIVLAVAVVAGTGYLVAGRHHTKTTASVSPVVVSPTLKKQSELTAHWKNFDHPGGAYSIKLVDGWRYLLQDNDFLFLQCTKDSVSQCTYAAGMPATVSDVYGGRDGITGLFIANGNMAPPSGQRIGTIKGANVSGDHYQQTVNNVAEEGMGPPSGTLVNQYYFEKSGHKIMIEYDQSPGAADNTYVVQAMVSTLKIH